MNEGRCRLRFPRYVPTWKEEGGYAAGYLAAAFDGEGCVNHPAGHGHGLRIGMSQNKNAMLVRVHEFLTEKRIPFTVTKHSGNPGLVETHLRKLPECLKFLGAYRPARLLARFGDLLFAEKFRPRLQAFEWLDVVSAEYLGEQDVIALESSSRTYFAGGFGAHNTAANDAGSAQVMRNDGSQLIGLVPSINELILLKGTRPYRLQGTAPSTYAITNIVPTTGSVGAVSFQANFFALNDVLYLSSAGITSLGTTQQFGDLKERFLSDLISLYFTPNTDFTVSLNQLSAAVAIYDAQNSRFMWGVDVNGDAQNDTLLVFDTFTKGWSVWPSQSCASLWIARNASNGQEEVFMGGYDGFVRVLNRSASANTIDGSARHISHLNAPGIEKSPRHVFLYFSEEGNYSVIVDTKFDFGRSGGQTYTASLLAGSKTLGVDWTMGVDPLGRKDQIIKRIDLSGVGEFLEIGVRNTAAGQPFTWLGYEVLWRPRRLVRRG